MSPRRMGCLGSLEYSPVVIRGPMTPPIVPFVTILTPVYNGEKYLAECIESVLAQTFKNWEYIIVNNCSTDRSLMIAESYARRDPRIKVCTNTSFVGVIENHNIAFSLVGRQSKYCKLISADDLIYPECIKLLVEVAERNPLVGIVGSYQLRPNRVMWKGVPSDVECIPGRDACRKTFLEDVAIFGPPTSSLYRADLVRSSQPFFSTSLPYADICAYYDYLDRSDFGFVHEVLSVERIHAGQFSTRSNELYADLVADIHNVLKYGPIYLSEDERDTVLKRYLATYYRRLGGSALKLKGSEFWKFHSARMRELECPLSWMRVIRALLSEIVNEMRDPRVACNKLAQVLKERWLVFSKAKG
jgi:glycosyltransferase involved in cell wall biosynthesis